MTNALPAVLSALTFGGADLQRADLSLHLDITLGLNDGLDVRGEDSVIPSAPGRVARNRQPDVRHIQLSGFLRGEGATEAEALAAWQTLRDEVEAIFNPLLEDVLEGVGLDGSTRSITCRPGPIIWTEALLGDGELTVALEAVAVDWDIEPAP